MHPQIDIKKINDRYFNYGVSIGNSAECYARDGLRSVAECIQDAGTALSGDFKVASIRYEGRDLGSFAVASMAHRTVALVDQLAPALSTTESFSQPQSEAAT